MSGVAGKTRIAVDLGMLPEGDTIAAYLVASGIALTATGTALDVSDAAALAELVAIAASTNGAYLELQDLTHAEDEPHTSGHAGVMQLAVRADVAGTLTDNDGDYSPLQVDADGNLRVTGTLIANIEGDYEEDSIHTSGDRGLFSLSVRNDNQSTTFTSGTGDYAPFATDQKGALYTKNVHNASSLQQIQTVGTTAVALPAAALANRTSMFVQLLSSGTLFLGSATVTNAGATRGFALQGNGSYAALDAGPSNVIYGVASSAGREVAIWEFA